MMNLWKDRPGYWKKNKYDGFVTDVWYPFEQRKRPGKLFEDEHIVTQVQHSLGVTDSYCAFYPHVLPGTDKPILTAWERGEKSPYYDQVYPDAVLRLYGVEFCDEYECGNHPILTAKEAAKAHPTYYKKSLNYKLDRYMAFFGQHKDVHLLIRVQKWTGRKFDRLGTDELFDKMLEYLETIGNKNRILIARHRDVCGDPDEVPGEIHHDDLGSPLAEVWFSPASPTAGPLSIEQFVGSKRT